VDLGALILGDEDERAPTTRFIVEEKEPTGDEDRDFADMLAHFRQKVAENIEAEDSSSHYDLGLAFKEMGLIDEAIAEFQVALRGGANPLATLEVLGQCFVEKGQYPVASRVLERALRLPDVADAELVGVLYHLGRSHEALGNSAQAVELYERVLSVDIRFRDAARRADALRGAGRAPGF
jgi:tetratricopeptide (TPR) repeat protein